MKRLFCPIFHLILILISQNVCSDEEADIKNIGITSSVLNDLAYAPTEGLLSSVVDGKVSVIGGDLIAGGLDLCLEGPEPLCLSHQYSSNNYTEFHGYTPADIQNGVGNRLRSVGVGNCYYHWHFLPFKRLYFDVHVGLERVIGLLSYKKEKRPMLTALVPQGSGGLLVHKKSFRKFLGNKDKEYIVPFQQEKGYTNCASGAISARTHPKNTTVTVNGGNQIAQVVSGSGEEWIYEGSVRHASSLKQFWWFRPKEVIKPNGNRIQYLSGNGQTIQAVDSSGSKLFSWLKLNWKSDRELHIENSHKGPAVCRFDPIIISNSTNEGQQGEFILASVTPPDAPEERYEHEYDRFMGAMLLKKILRPEGRFLEIDYYKRGDEVGGRFSIKLNSRFDPRMKRVKELKSPVGCDATPITTHRFSYQLECKVDNQSGKVEIGKGYTTVLDAYNNKTVYGYNEKQRLILRKQYVDNKSYLTHKYFWPESFDNKELQEKCEGQLLGKLISSGKENFSYRYFTYDDKGNILSDNLCGNLTGNCKAPIVVEDNYIPVMNGVEIYSKQFKYSNDKFNLLLEELEPSGKKIVYNYYPDSDLLKSKFLCDQKGILQREFFKYDSNNTLIRHIVDNGKATGQFDLKGVTERRYTYIEPTSVIPLGLPEKTEEYYMDMASGEKKLLKKICRRYSSEGRLLQEDLFDSDGLFRFSRSWEYDAHGNVILETDPLGSSIVRQYDANDNLIFEQGPSSDHYTLHTYDYSNRLIKTETVCQNGDRHTVYYRYDYLGNRIAKVDRYGNETIYNYDSLSRLVETIYPQVQEGVPVEKIFYNAVGDPIVKVDVLGNETRSEFNIRGKSFKTIYPDGKTEMSEYAIDGQLMKKTAANGTVTVYERDALGRVLSESVSDSSGSLLLRTESIYDGLHLISTRDAEGLETFFEYDGAGRLKKKRWGDKSEEYVYDALGRQNKKIENGQRVHAYEYDLIDRIVEERLEDVNGHLYGRTCYRYDIFGNRTHIIQDTNAGECIQLMEYDSEKRVKRKVDPEGNESWFEYNHRFINELGQAVLQITMTDPSGRQTITTHDALGRGVSTEIWDSMGVLLAKQASRYDLKGNLVAAVDHVLAGNVELRKSTTVWEYDGEGHLTALLEAYGQPEQKVTRYTYNSIGQRTSLAKPDGIFLRYEYDSLGRLKRHKSSDGSLNDIYTYNRRNQPLAVTRKNGDSTELVYDHLGRLKSEKLEHGLGVEYDYDVFDRVVKTTFPDRTSVEYHYDPVHLLEVKRKGTKEDYSHLYKEYDLSGKLLKGLNIFGCESKYAYNAAQKPTAWHEPDWKADSIQFDRLGRLTGYHLTDELGSEEREYSYDSMDHLVSEPLHSYACDSLDNRLSKDGVSQSYNHLNQLLEQGDVKYRYDANGNLVEKQVGDEVISYRYDVLDRLVKVTKAGKNSFYRYDPFHRRIIKNRKRFLYIGMNEIGSPDLNELRILGLGSGAEVGATIAIELNEKVLAVSNDLHGNIVALSDRSGVVQTYRYTAFGEQSVKDKIGNPWRFSGKRWDPASSCYYFGRRFYDPAVGRWMTPDPAGYIDGRNLYAYLHHHPLTSIDLYGYNEEELYANNGEERYPLADVELRDDRNPQSETEAQPNTPPIEQQKKKWKNGWYCGECETSKVLLYWLNGIMNNLCGSCHSATRISKMADGHYVDFLHNRSTGFILTDLIRCFSELVFYAQTDAVKNLRSQLVEILQNNPGTHLMLNCHSEGAIVTRNALIDIPDEYRKFVHVRAYAPAAYINKSLCGSIQHFRSKRDIVPLFDVVGMVRCRDTITVLDPKPASPWFDHSFDSPTYHESQDREIRQFIDDFGSL